MKAETELDLIEEATVVKSAAVMVAAAPAVPPPVSHSATLFLY